MTNGSEHELASYQNVNYTYVNDTHLSSVSGTDVFGQQSNYQLYYDALGRCAVRILNGSTTYYIYDGEKSILEYRGWSAPSAADIYGKSIDEILVRTDYTVSPARTVYYQDDHEGNITHLTDAGGSIVEWYRYDAFGKPSIYKSSGSQITSSAYGNRIMFTGREYVATFGIYEYRNRAYHPGLGRFMSEDPKLFVHRVGLGKEPEKWDFFQHPDDGEANLFRYVGNDPLDFTDPMGLDTYPTNDSVEGFFSNDFSGFGGYLHDVGQTAIGELKGAAFILSGGGYQPSFANENQEIGGFVGGGLVLGGTFAAAKASPRAASSEPSSINARPTAGEAQSARPSSASASANPGTVNPKIYAQLQNQLNRDGARTIQTSLKSAQEALGEHQQKLAQIQAQGGHTSYVESTIKNIQNQIETLKAFMQDNNIQPQSK
jgi:RHS repeat-associated protein